MKAGSGGEPATRQVVVSSGGNPIRFQNTVPSRPTMYCRRKKLLICTVTFTTLLFLVVLFSRSAHNKLSLSWTIGSKFRSCKYNYQDSNKDFHTGEGVHPVIVWWSPLGDVIRKVIDCPQGKCFITSTKEFYNHSRTVAYLFYASSMCWGDLPVPRQTDRIWALLHEESPRNNWILTQEDGLRLFNFTSTFSRFSNLPLTTLSLENPKDLTNFKTVSVGDKNEFRRKGFAPVAYLQSNCNPPSDRESYIAELMKFIDVDSYGQCLHNKDLPSDLTDPIQGMDAERTYNILSKYKFLLTFENAICEDYITEKLWRPLHVGSVPVIRGSPSVRDWLPNNKSGIIVEEFASPKELADFLLSLDKDDKEYEEYLKWKKEGITNQRLLQDLKERPWSFDDAPGKYHSFVDAFECKVCDYAYEVQRKRKRGEKVTRMASRADFNCRPPARALRASAGVKSLMYAKMWARSERCSHKTAPLIHKAVTRGYNNAQILDYLDDFYC